MKNKEERRKNLDKYTEDLFEIGRKNKDVPFFHRLYCCIRIADGAIEKVLDDKYGDREILLRGFLEEALPLTSKLEKILFNIGTLQNLDYFTMGEGAFSKS